MLRRRELWSPLPAILRRKALPLTAYDFVFYRSLSTAKIYSSNFNGISSRAFISRSKFHFLGNPLKFTVKNLCSESANKVNATCWRCNAQPQWSAFLVCESCRAIQPVDQSVDYFQIFGLDKKYEIKDENLEGKYKDWQKKLHPDLVHSKSQKERDFAAEQSARVTDAYRTLSNPRLRAVYILKLKGVDVDEKETISEPQLLAEIMEIREAVEEAPNSEALTNIQSQMREKLQHCSTLSKLSKFSHAKKTQLPQQAENGTINPLFKEITAILGADNLVVWKELHPENVGSNDELKSCTGGVCGNVELNNVLNGKDSLLGSDSNQIRNLNEIDVAPIVHDIVGILREENGPVPMEERLESLDFQFEPEIVEKVLKRCFKVPHLAFRFFNWVKMKDGFCHTTKTFNTLLYIAGEAKEFVVVDDLVEEMETNLCKMDIKTWTILISQFGKAKLIGKALFFFEKMKKSWFEPDEKIYKFMVHLLCDAKKGEIVFELYKEMIQKDIRLDLSLYKMLLNSIAKLGDVDAVKLIANDMIRVAQISEADVYISMLKSFCMAGRITEALEVIRDLKNKDILIDYEYFEILLKGLCKAGRVADAMEIFEIMKKKDFVDAKAYGIIINGYLRRKELSKALELFQCLKESGYRPTTSTYTELMQHLFNLNQYQKGFQLYDEMLETGIKLDSVAIMAVVAGHVRQNHVSEAWETFNTMEARGIKPTWKSYSIFIKELCKVSRTDKILDVLYKMQTSKIFINSEIFEWVISCMEKKGEIANIQKVKQMQRIHRLDSQGDDKVSREQELQVEQDHKPSMALIDHQLVKPLSKSYSEQDLQQVCQILSSSVDWCIKQEALEKCSVRFTPELVLEILHNCSRDGNAALHFFSWVGARTGYHHTTETYNMAMKIAGRGKDFKHMRSVFSEMRRKGCLITPDTWTIMIMQYGRTGLTEIALKIFYEMKKKGYKPTRSTYKYLVISLCGRKGRRVDEAIILFQEMIHAQYIPDRETVGTYLSCLCESGKLLEARRSADSLCKVGFTGPLSCSLHIRALCRAGRLEEALSLLDEVGEERATLDRYAYGTLVHGLLQVGREEEALAKVSSMKQAGILPTVHVYTSLIVHFLKEKQIEKAMEIFQEMQMEGCKPTIVTHSAFIRGYMNMGRVDDARNVFNFLKQKGPLPDFKTYSMFISCLCRCGRSEEALQLISEMPDHGIVPSTINFRTVFYGLNREGKNDLARTVLHQKFKLRSKRKFLT